MNQPNPSISAAGDAMLQSLGMRQQKVGHWLGIAVGTVVIAATIVLAYARAIPAPFYADDFTSLNHNPSIRRLWPLLTFSDSWCPLRPSPNSPVSGRPLVNLSFAINYHFVQLNPFAYRATNVGIHLLATLFLWAIVYRTLRLDFFAGRFESVAGLLSFFSALIWGLHPLNTEAVAYVTQRTESLMGLFYLATFYASLRYFAAEQSAARFCWLIGAAAACIAGAMSKEMMASVPAVVLAYERTFLRGSFWRALRHSWPLYLALAMGWIPLLLINRHGVQTPSAGFGFGLPAYVWWYTQTEVFLLYLKLVFWPWPLVAHYEIPYIAAFASGWRWIVPAALIGLATIVLLWRRTSAGFVMLAVIAGLSPTLVFPCINEIVAERRMYVPLAAIVPLVVAGMYWLLASRAERRRPTTGSLRPAKAALVVWLIGFSSVAAIFELVSMRRLASYKDALTLLEDAVGHQPDDFSILINLAIELARAGRTNEAIARLDHAADLYRYSPVLNYKLSPEAHKLFYNRALVYESLGRPSDAVRNYECALEIRPDFAEGHYNLALLLDRAGCAASAINEYQQALDIDPEYAPAHCNLGALLLALGRYDQALPHLETGARLLGQDIANQVNLAQAYAKMGRSQDAIRAAESALHLAHQQGKNELSDQISSWLNTISSGKSKP